ncbi:MAG TPA: PQQ-binding-like beta-propeller repeat protein [Rhizomicrobium sp.]|nr:PQQ-binding-like beta-propeller repeat protein [Rhizomicrobium sp.]
MKTRFLMVAALAGFTPIAALADSVVTYHNSNQRDGAYTIPGLTLSAAANMQRDTKFDGTISGHVYAQPLFWKPKGTKRGLVIVATESNTVYALNESSGKIVWRTTLANPMPLNQLPCGNIDPMGVTGTPVIDPASGRLYLDAMTKTSNGARHMVYALSLADGSIVSGWPLDMQALLTGQGATFDSSVHGERSALLFFKNKLYVNYGGHFGDCGAYRGTVAQIDPGSATLDANWQTRDTGGGIWAQGGIAGDGTNLFITTGNTFSGSQWRDGEAIIRLHPGLVHSDDTHDFFTPSNWKSLDNSDEDLGGTEALPIDIHGKRTSKRVIAFGKDGNAYLANRNNLGGIGGQIQVVQAANGSIRTAPAVFETDTSTMVAFTNSGSSHCSGSNVTMLNVAPSGKAPISFAWCAQYNGSNGGPIVTTTDGAANAIVWVPGAEGDNELHGFNAQTGAVVFPGTGTGMSGLHHYQTILATQKRFYVAGDGKVFSFRWN